MLQQINYGYATKIIGQGQGKILTTVNKKANVN